jgi:hypothetical protein
LVGLSMNVAMRRILRKTELVSSSLVVLLERQAINQQMKPDARA